MAYKFMTTSAKVGGSIIILLPISLTLKIESTDLRRQILLAEISKEKINSP
jgi:hypothetical protein